MAADSQKLIAYGKVLEDEAKTLKEYSIKEGDFLVVMVSKVGESDSNHRSPSPSLSLLRSLRSPSPLLRPNLRPKLSPLSQFRSLPSNRLQHRINHLLAQQASPPRLR